MIDGDALNIAPELLRRRKLRQTVAAGALRVALGHVTGAELGARVVAERSAVSRWQSGDSVPPMPRRRLLELHFGIPADTWNVRASKR